MYGAYVDERFYCCSWLGVSTCELGIRMREVAYFCLLVLLRGLRTWIAVLDP